MEVEIFERLISSLGYPIVVSGVMFYVYDKSMKEMKQAIYDCNMSVQICAGAVQQLTDLIKLLLDEKIDAKEGE